MEPVPVSNPYHRGIGMGIDDHYKLQPLRTRNNCTTVTEHFNNSRRSAKRLLYLRYYFMYLFSIIKLGGDQQINHFIAFCVLLSTVTDYINSEQLIFSSSEINNI